MLLLGYKKSKGENMERVKWKLKKLIFKLKKLFKIDEPKTADEFEEQQW
jgi:hypothetical protein